MTLATPNLIVWASMWAVQALARAAVGLLERRVGR